MFEDLTEEELIQLYNLNPISVKVADIIKAEKEYSWPALQEHAYWDYWNRKLNTLNRLLTMEEIEDILLFSKKIPTVKSLIGEAAAKECLSKEQCEELLPQFEPADWVYVQLKAIILLSGLDDSMKAADKQIYVLQVLEELIQLRRDSWAIKKVLNYMTPEELLKFKERLFADRSILNKGNRHFLRERIDKILKSKIPH